MALIKCPECGRENVSDSAEMCPSCGYGIKASFAAIEQQRILAQRQIEEEKRRKEEQIRREKEEQAELNEIKMPGKPSIVKSLLLFGIAFAPFVLLALLVKSSIGIWFFLIFWFIIAASSYRDDVKKYNKAQQDFKAYQAEEVRRKKLAIEMSAIGGTNALKCPICNSTSVKRISTLSRAASIAAVGLASAEIGKQYKCSGCGHMW